MIFVNLVYNERLGIIGIINTWNILYDNDSITTIKMTNNELQRMVFSFLFGGQVSAPFLTFGPVSKGFPNVT